MHLILQTESKARSTKLMTNFITIFFQESKVVKKTLISCLTFFIIIFAPAGIFFVSAQDKSFENYKMVEFDFQGRNAKLVVPDNPNNAKYWIWRARFWGHEPQTDLALLKKGFHLAYVDIGGLYGNQEAVNIWNQFYNYLIEKYHLNKKVVLEGMSRGGLIVYNWASVNTDKVACIYADAPVCDIKSWPGGLYNGTGSKKDWERCLEAYGLEENEVKNFKNIPTNNSLKVAKAGIPVIHVCGDADMVVPFSENTKLLMKNFETEGSKFKLILKKGVGHHPHSLKNPRPIVKFILKNTIKSGRKIK